MYIVLLQNALIVGLFDSSSAADFFRDGVDVVVAGLVLVVLHLVHRDDPRLLEAEIIIRRARKGQNIIVN